MWLLIHDGMKDNHDSKRNPAIIVQLIHTQHAFDEDIYNKTN